MNRAWTYNSTHDQCTRINACELQFLPLHAMMAGIDILCGMVHDYVTIEAYNQITINISQ